MGKQAIIKAHSYTGINERVQAAIARAADEVHALVTQPGAVHDPDLRAQIHSIIRDNAYYGDAARNGEITDVELERIREFAAQ
jgi:ABC-type arginine transport system ATPase subunit